VRACLVSSIYDRSNSQMEQHAFVGLPVVVGLGSRARREGHAVLPRTGRAIRPPGSSGLYHDAICCRRGGGTPSNPPKPGPPIARPAEQLRHGWPRGSDTQNAAVQRPVSGAQRPAASGAGPSRRELALQRCTSSERRGASDASRAKARRQTGTERTRRPRQRSDTPTRRRREMPCARCSGRVFGPGNSPPLRGRRDDGGLVSRPGRVPPIFPSVRSTHAVGDPSGVAVDHMSSLSSFALLLPSEEYICRFSRRRGTHCSCPGPARG
jgi:hypothetical protein